MFVEDGLEAMVAAVVDHDLFEAQPRDREFVLSVGRQWLEKHRISTAQGDHVMRILKRAVDAEPILMGKFGITAETLRESVTYRVQPSETTKVVRNEIRWLGEGLVGLRFRPSTDVLEAVKRMAKTSLSGWPRRPGSFVRSDLLWIIPVNRLTLAPLTRLVTDHGFDLDETSRQAMLDLADAIEADLPSSALDAPDLGKIFVQVADNPWIEDWMEMMAHGERVE